MERKSFFPGVIIADIGKLVLALIVIGALGLGCRVLPGAAEVVPPTQEQVPQPTSTLPDADTAAVQEALDVLAGDSLAFCFAYPRGYTEIITAEQVEVAVPQTASNPQPVLAWIDTAAAQGRSAQEIADQEVDELGGSPPRSSVLLGGEEALVLDGMPGQDPIRKVYIVHDGLLYTLSFSPYLPDNAAAMAQMEVLFEALTSTWTWLSAGESCPLTN